MASVYVKTESGQSELRDRLLNLPRSARTLLVLVDGTRGAEQLLSMVKAATTDDLDTLVRLKLIAESAAGGSPAASAAGREKHHGAAAHEPAEAGAGAADAAAAAPLDYKEMYVVLNELVREQLGIMKAFRYTLEVEKATDVQQLMVVAERFAKEVQSVKGDTAAKMVRRALGLTAV